MNNLFNWLFYANTYGYLKAAMVTPNGAAPAYKGLDPLWHTGCSICRLFHLFHQVPQSKQEVL